MYAQVVVDIATRALSALFTYKIPNDSGFPRIVEGSAVLVPFRSRLAIAFVVAISDELPSELVGKEDRIEMILDALEDPFFDAEQIQLAHFIQQTYGGSLIEAFRPFINLSGRVVIDESEEAPRLKLERATLRYESSYRLAQQKGEACLAKNALKQRAVLELFEQMPAGRALSRSAILARIPNSAPAIKALARSGFLTEEKESSLVSRSEAAPSMFWEQETHDQAKEFNKEQQEAYERISASLDTHKTFVLDGVTGSGKTEVYLQVIDEVLKEGKSALVLIPEISLTFQTVRRFAARFPGLVAVIHSRLTESERKTQLELIMTGQARVLVGARSALFAPLKKLGIIIIDEEHDDSYKQGSAPRYHARDVAEENARIRNIPLVLGSATPSLFSLLKVEKGEWEQLAMRTRINEQELPKVTLIDMASEFRAKSRSIFSLELLDALKGVFERKEKAMLLLNRRGTASFFLCRDCGYVPKCQDCSTSLTYHGDRNHLRCHTCNLIEDVPPTCPECGSIYLKQMGAGTQHIEAELKNHFPDWPIIRMDADTTRARGGHEEVLRAFDAQESACLIGTQMIAKGHDFPEITLVGVIMADIGLHFSDYRASEISYYLLEQVSGRAGRAHLKGEVIIQTYLPEHAVLQAVKSHERDLFLKPELEMRKELNYPPYARLANIIASSYKEAEAREYLVSLKENIQKDEYFKDMQILGPTASLFTRIKNRYRYHLLIKAAPNAKLGARLNELIAKTKAPQNLNVALDVDPMSLV